MLGPFSIHHVQNSGIAFGLFASATSFVILLTSVAVAWMLFFFARSGARHPILPVGLGLVIGGSASNLVGVAVLLVTRVATEREPRRRRIADGSSPGS